MSDLRAKVEGLRRGDADYIYGKRDPEFCETWNSAIDAGLDLIPEGAVLVTPADLQAMIHDHAPLHGDGFHHIDCADAAAILARLRETP